MKNGERTIAENSNSGNNSFTSSKYDTDGDKLWTRQLGTAGFDEGLGVSVDGSGNAYVTGFTKGGLDGNTSAGRSDMFLTKYDTVGSKQWTRQLGTAGYDSGRGVSVDDSGNVYVTGETWGNLDGNTNAGWYDMFLTKYDTTGTKWWTKQVGSVDKDGGSGVSVDGSGNVYVTGFNSSIIDGNTDAWHTDMFLSRYDTDGSKLWTEQLGTASRDVGLDVSVDGSGNVYVTGYTDGDLDGNTNAGGTDMFLVKISSVPEPGSVVMLVGVGLVGLLYRRRKCG